MASEGTPDDLRVDGGPEEAQGAPGGAPDESLNNEKGAPSEHICEERYLKGPPEAALGVPRQQDGEKDGDFLSESHLSLAGGAPPEACGAPWQEKDESLCVSPCSQTNEKGAPEVPGAPPSAPEGPRDGLGPPQGPLKKQQGDEEGAPFSRHNEDRDMGAPDEVPKADGGPPKASGAGDPPLEMKSWGSLGPSSPRVQQQQQQPSSGPPRLQQSRRQQPHSGAPPIQGAS